MHHQKLRVQVITDASDSVLDVNFQVAAMCYGKLIVNAGKCLDVKLKCIEIFCSVK